MPAVLTTSASSVTCMHTGRVETSSTAQLQVNGQKVLLQASINGRNIVGCVTPNAPDKGNLPCLHVTAVLGSCLANKLKVNNQPVVLEAPAGWGQTDGTVGFSPQPLAISVAHQSKLRAI